MEAKVQQLDFSLDRIFLSLKGITVINSIFFLFFRFYIAIVDQGGFGIGNLNVLFFISYGSPIH